jgi:hypothetical protein
MALPSRRALKRARDRRTDPRYPHAILARTPRQRTGHAHRRRTRSRRRAAVPDGLVNPIQRMRRCWPRLHQRALIGDLRARKRVPARLLKIRLPHV